MSGLPKGLKNMRADGRKLDTLYDDELDQDFLKVIAQKHHVKPELIVRGEYKRLDGKDNEGYTGFIVFEAKGDKFFIHVAWKGNKGWKSHFTWKDEGVAELDLERLV